MSWYTCVVVHVSHVPMVCHSTAVPNSFDHGTRILVELVTHVYVHVYPAAAAVGAAAAGAAGAAQQRLDFST